MCHPAPQLSTPSPSPFLENLSLWVGAVGLRTGFPGSCGGHEPRQLGPRKPLAPHRSSSEGAAVARDGVRAVSGRTMSEREGGRGGPVQHFKPRHRNADSWPSCLGDESGPLWEVTGMHSRRIPGSPPTGSGKVAWFNRSAGGESGQGGSRPHGGARAKSASSGQGWCGPPIGWPSSPHSELRSPVRWPGGPSRLPGAVPGRDVAASSPSRSGPRSCARRPRRPGRNGRSVKANICHKRFDVHALPQPGCLTTGSFPAPV